jgi:Rho termination factor, N-terminal domain
MEAFSEIILAVINIIIPACITGITVAFLVGFLEYRYTTHNTGIHNAGILDTTSTRTACNTIPNIAPRLELRPGAGTGDYPTGGGAHHLPFHRSSPPTPCPLPDSHPQVIINEDSIDIISSKGGSDTKVGDLKSKTVVELKAIAKGLRITGFSRWNKRELVNQIELVLERGKS